MSDAKSLSALEPLSVEIVEVPKNLNKEESADWNDVIKRVTMNFGTTSHKRQAARGLRGQRNLAS